MKGTTCALFTPTICSVISLECIDRLWTLAPLPLDFCVEFAIAGAVKTGSVSDIPAAHGVDALHSGCDNAPAFVPLHGVGHGADANCQVVIGAVPAFQYPQVLIAPADGMSASGS